MLHPKKVGTLPVAWRDEEKQPNEIKTAIPLLEAIEIRGKTISADALFTQRELARYLVEERGAHYHFTVTGNQTHLLEETAFYFAHCEHPPNFTTTDGDHGRLEIRTILVTTELNAYLSFPACRASLYGGTVYQEQKNGEGTPGAGLWDYQQTAGLGDGQANPARQPGPWDH